ncbi:MAG TPA: hypothetical protein VH498_06085 [Candidatus Dormibacteraeota bacterium]|nr:hypothetical protein [Candidatus Dormibacteraeota bacterium]
MRPAAQGPDPHAPLRRRLRHHYRLHFQDPRRERLFLSSVGFDLGAISARVITHMIRRGIGPFHNLSRNGRHLHHLVFGIGGLLVTGYLWLLIADDAEQQKAIHSLNSVIYGVGSALTLDEFALWLDLEDVYWTKRGKVSVEALMIFGGLLSIGVWGGSFLKDAAREITPWLSVPAAPPLGGTRRPTQLGPRRATQ